MPSLHPREQIPVLNCVTCGHPVVEIRRFEKLPHTEGKVENWVLGHANPADEDGCPCIAAGKDSCALQDEKLNHPPHKCLACSCRILSEEPEVKVVLRKPRGQARYRHATDDQCRAAMNQDYGPRWLSGGLARGKK